MSLPTQFKNRNHALVLGAGISGLSAASLLISKGYKVTVLGSCNNEEKKTQLATLGVKFDVSEMDSYIQNFCDSKENTSKIFAVLSPGISPKSNPIKLLYQAQIPIIGEMELGLTLGDKLLKFIAITGSKGKSSIVKLIADTLTQAGKPAIPCGNYGTATCSVAETNESVIPVVECSSFQLETTTSEFSPYAALLLNLSPDHLDRHSSMEEYRDAKLRIFSHCSGIKLIPETCDYNIDESITKQGMQIDSFTRFGTSPSSAYKYIEGKIYISATGEYINISGSYFDNSIIGPGAAAAVAILLEYGLTIKQIEDGFKNFVPLNHRMQKIRELEGVTFINDSKATSIAALFAGCKMASKAKKPIYLIAGGKLKEKISLNANDLVDFYVKKVYIIGECLEEMASAWEKDIAIERCYTMDVAVNQAFKAAKEEESIILLSPGTASFDQFKSYNQRGECFTKLVEQL
ncbi:MAG: UDP-N-acetylmuramoyl-L-alanine--D-glutamate ligase [Kiritimatiellae bacterium]|nr:UDP-N-acetylmuramoyl-L-alanine--D-glutamate ligase [Kiritimatiellia bacterium]